MKNSRNCLNQITQTGAIAHNYHYFENLKVEHNYRIFQWIPSQNSQEQKKQVPKQEYPTLNTYEKFRKRNLKYSKGRYARKKNI